MWDDISIESFASLVREGYVCTFLCSSVGVSVDIWYLLTTVDGGFDVPEYPLSLEVERVSWSGLMFFTGALKDHRRGVGEASRSIYSERSKVDVGSNYKYRREELYESHDVFSSSIRSEDPVSWPTVGSTDF